MIDETQEARTHQIEGELRAAMEEAIPRIQQAHRWEMQILRWCMSDAALRTQILRFIDCLPALESPREVVQHLKEYFPLRSGVLPLPLRLGLAATSPRLITAGAVASATRHTVSTMARLFLAGADLKEAFGRIGQLEGQGFQVSVDLLGEATTSQAEAQRYTQRYLEIIREWRSHLSSTPHLSLKLSSLAFPFEPVDPEGAWRQIRPRFSRILQAAFEQGGFVNVDMEQVALRDLTLTLTQRTLDEQFPGESRVGVVIQAYLKDSEEVTRGLIRWVISRKAPVTVRLVRGAYWDSEVIRSRQLGWPCPVYTEKAETDASFDRLTDLLFEHHDHLRIAVATHNLRSIAHAIAKAQELRAPQSHWEAQLLYGMGEAIQWAIHRHRIPVRIYTPVGELIPGMAYLVRRILENSSHNSFLAANLLEHERAAH
ncbi:MAG: proline dehydrogenase family protein [Candidatus Omnitrophica bacterium]|nr:proline dehydrogenase family protein [Candidatus Omnitrophota bacterium]